MMDKVFAKQRGRNVEVCLEEIVIKIKTGLNLVRDIEETLHKLQRVNVKIDPSKCTFGMEEGKFLGYVATTKGIKADPEKVKVILRSTMPRGPEQIRSISLQLTNISRFILKLAELMLPIRPDTHFLCEPAVVRVGNLLHFNGESNADTNPHGKILKNNFPDIQSQRGNRCPYGRDTKMREAKGKIVKKFFGKGEQVLQAPELNKEGSDVGMILVDPKGKEYSHDVCLNFYASEDNMDYEALLAGLVAFAGRNMKDIHGRDHGRHPNVLNPKAEALTGLASIRLELLNQEVSVGVKTRPSVEAQDKLQEKERNTSKKPSSRKSSPGWEDCSGSN
ncbi:hypothetical protein Tco_1277116 [Tanacetum coccineum]